MSSMILIVDDGPDWREMLSGLIKDISADYSVRTAASLEEAKRQMARKEACVLAIIDIRLDESDEDNVDGLELLDFLRANHPQTKALIITSYANLDTVKRAMQPNKAGVRSAADYVEKDKLQTELLPRVAKILKKSS